MRIEFQERFVDMTDEEIEEAQNLKIKLEYKYRRIYPKLSMIDYPAEIPGKKSHCRLYFIDGTSLIIKGSYDETCVKIDDREQLEEASRWANMKEEDDTL
jgi:hypothetical protein